MQRYYIGYNTLIGCKLNFNFFHKNSKKQNKKLVLTLFMILFKKSRNIIGRFMEISLHSPVMVQKYLIRDSKIFNRNSKYFSIFNNTPPTR